MIDDDDDDEDEDEDDDFVVCDSAIFAGFSICTLQNGESMIYIKIYQINRGILYCIASEA